MATIKSQIAVVGATGLVGLEIQKILQERYSGLISSGQLQVKLFASSARPGDKVLALSDSWGELAKCDYILNASSSEVAVELREKLKPNQVLIDNSSAHRMDPEVPLIVPEVNLELIDSNPSVIANPNCTAILLCVALKPLMEFGLQRVVVSTYQSASGAGVKGLEELDAQLNNFNPEQLKKNDCPVFGFPLAGNVMSHNTEIRGMDVVGSGYNEEEWKVIEESRKIIGILHLAISATCLRVPVRRAHTESITVDLKLEVSLEKLREAYSQASGIKIVDDWENNHFPMPLESQNQDLVYVGRIRKDATIGRAVHLLISGDQIRKGAATNAVQIMEALMKRRGQLD